MSDKVNAYYRLAISDPKVTRLLTYKHQGKATTAFYCLLMGTRWDLALWKVVGKEKNLLYYYAGLTRSSSAFAEVTHKRIHETQRVPLEDLWEEYWEAKLQTKATEEKVRKKADRKMKKLLEAQYE